MAYEQILVNRLILNNRAKRKMWRIRKFATLCAQFTALGGWPNLLSPKGSGRIVAHAHRGRPSCPPGKFPRLGGHLDLLSLFDEQGNADFQAGFQLGQL